MSGGMIQGRCTCFRHNYKFSSSRGLFIVKEHYYKWTLRVWVVAHIGCPDFCCYFIIESQQVTVYIIWNLTCWRLSNCFVLASVKLQVGLWISLSSTCFELSKHASQWGNSAISVLLWYKGFCKSLGKISNCCPKLRFNHRPCEYLATTNVFSLCEGFPF